MFDDDEALVLGVEPGCDCGIYPPRNGSLVVAVEEFGVVGGVPSVEDHPFKVLAFFCGHGGCCGFCVG